LSELSKLDKVGTVIVPPVKPLVFVHVFADVFTLSIAVFTKAVVAGAVVLFAAVCVVNEYVAPVHP
jgi:hypothetical protein